MKKFLLVFLILAAVSLKADPPQLLWRMTNPRIIKSTQQRFEFEIQVKANQGGTYYSSGQCMFYFNNYAIAYTSLAWTVIPAGISAQTHPDVGNKYVISRVTSGSYPGVKILIGLSPTDEAVLDESPNAGYLAEITTEWQTYVKVQCRITDPSADSEINFYQEGTDGQNFYLSAPGIESGYQNPNQYNSLSLATASLARIFCSTHGWSQYGGETDNVQYLDWTTAVNTSVWEGNATVEGNNCNALNLHIHNGASMQITDQTNLTVSGMMMNESGNTGLKLFSSAAGTASLIHNSNHVSATVQRYLTGNSDLGQQAYHNIAVPIQFSATTGFLINSYLFRFDSPTQSWISMGNETDTPLNTHEGYLVYYPHPDTTYEYTGMMFNDMVSLDVAYNTANGYTGLNLVPNPYPSAIDWNNELGWTKYNINDAYWVWNPVLRNYASYGAGIGINDATQFIPSGQSFFVKAYNEFPSLMVNNSARVHNSQAFFKEGLNQKLLRIKTLANMSQDEIVLQFKENASETYDPTEDIDKFFGSADAPQLYSNANDQVKLSVNTLPFPSGLTTIPISFEMGVNAAVSLSAENVESLSDFAAVLLEDLQTGEITDLRTHHDYSFLHDTIYESNRFLLHLQYLTDVVDLNADPYRIWGFDRNIYFSIPSCTGERIRLVISDITGRIAVDREMTAEVVNRISIPGFNGTALIKVYSGEKIYFGKVLLVR
jgi:hypothetical protein